MKYPRVQGYRLVQQIGGGGFSTVFRAVHFEERRVAACKVIPITAKTTDKDRKTLDKETRVHAGLQHKNILEFIGAVIVEPDDASHYFPAHYILMELAAGGDLFDKIAPDVGIGEEISHYYFGQLLAGLTYMHNMGVCHRDLKPENLLLDAAGALKISDFGLCAVYKLVDTGQTRMLKERCGSLPYVAPELDGIAAYEAEPVDVWGSGVILYTMLAGNTPWDEPTKQSYEYCHYLSGKCFNTDPWNRFSEDLLSLLTGMLSIDPERRMTLEEVAAHPWMLRPSQIARRGLAGLAESLTESLRRTGDLDIAEPGALSRRVDEDGDQIMGTAGTTMSQFTQSLLLFSQTQSGRRYSPSLTRFYAAIGPHILLPLVQEALREENVKYGSVSEVESIHGREGTTLRMRIGGYDKRKLMYKGTVEVERFAWDDVNGSFFVMQRDQGNPISWRQLWKTIIESPAVEPHVLRRRK